MTAVHNLLRLGLLLGLAALGASLAGCGSTDERAQGIDVQEVYRRGQAAMRSGDFRRAVTIFQQLQARFPFADVSKQAQLDLIYSYYKSRSPEQAVDAADQFIRENPTHPRVDYAIYIKGLAYFENDAGPLESLLRVDRATRPPLDAERSFSLFKQLVQRFPASPYAADATQRMVFLKNRLARYENHVARYYMRRGAYVAALNRAKYALEEYDGSPANKESLEILVQAYDKLDLEDLASDARRVLERNYRR